MSRRKKPSWVYEAWDAQVLDNASEDPEERRRLRETLFTKCYVNGRWTVPVDDAGLVAGLFLSGPPLGPWIARKIEVGDLFFSHPEVDSLDGVTYTSLRNWLAVAHLVSGDYAQAVRCLRSAFQKDAQAARVSIRSLLPGACRLLPLDEEADEGIVHFANGLFATWPNKKVQKIKLPQRATWIELAQITDRFDEPEERFRGLARELFLLDATDQPVQASIDTWLELFFRSYLDDRWLISAVEVAGLCERGMHLYLIAGAEDKALKVAEAFDRHADGVSLDAEAQRSYNSQRVVVALVTGDHNLAAELLRDLIDDYWFRYRLYQQASTFTRLHGKDIALTDEVIPLLNGVIDRWGDPTVPRTSLGRASTLAAFVRILRDLQQRHRDAIKSS